jgi:hypothetical protein
MIIEGYTLITVSAHQSEAIRGLLGYLEKKSPRVKFEIRNSGDDAQIVVQGADAQSFLIYAERCVGYMAGFKDGRISGLKSGLRKNLRKKK